MKKRYLFLTLVILIFAWSYFDYFRYQIIINKQIGKHFVIDGEHKCYINYEYQCPNNNCYSLEATEFTYYNAYFENLFDAVKYAENNYQKFYNDIPDNLIKNMIYIECILSIQYVKQMMIITHMDMQLLLEELIFINFIKNIILTLINFILSKKYITI